MMQQQTDDVVDRVRAARRSISESVGHDPEALIRHYQERERRNPERMLKSREDSVKEGSKA
jgi:hypothetical protein